jgi:hypothetical protein
MKINLDKIKQIAKDIAEMHPYKKLGDMDSYSNYNQGWEDACYILLDKILENLTSKKRTLSQNNSLHLWFTQIAEMLNETGQTYTNEMGIPCVYTMELLKEVYWKPTQKQLFDIESTKEMTGTILNNLIDSFTLWLSESKGIEAPPFPNKQLLIMKLEKEGKLK